MVDMSDTTTTTTQYQPLKFPVVTRQFTYRLLQRSGKVCLVEQVSTQAGHRYAYEVWVIQHRPESKFPDGSITPAREVAPPAESWGTFGWTLMDLKRAQEVFDRELTGTPKAPKGDSRVKGSPKGRHRKSPEGDHSGQLVEV